MDQPTHSHPIKSFFENDPWRVRIFFIGALWWFPFLVYGGFVRAYYGPSVNPPAYLRMDIIEHVQWFITKVTWPLAMVSIGVIFAYILLQRIFGKRFFSFINITINHITVVIGLGVIFMAYWGAIALLVYEGQKKFVRWARGEG